MKRIIRYNICIKSFVYKYYEAIKNRSINFRNKYYLYSLNIIYLFLSI